MLHMAAGNFLSHRDAAAEHISGWAVGVAYL